MHPPLLVPPKSSTENENLIIPPFYGDNSPIDTLDTKQRSERMGRIRNKDTALEMTIRCLVHGVGYRYRLHCR
jgi:hypothetical protein